MEKNKNMQDLEQVVYELIQYFMKWGVWSGISIQCGGKIYTDTESAEKWSSGESAFFFGCEKDAAGLRELENVAVFIDPRKPEDSGGNDWCVNWGVKSEDAELIMSLDLGRDVLVLFMWDGYCENYRICYKRMSPEAKRFLLANTCYGKELLFELYEEMEALRDQDWVLQDYDTCEEWTETHDILGDPVPDLCPDDGPPLDMENPERYDDWWGWNDPHLGAAASKDVINHMLDEFKSLLEKHGLFYIEPLGDRLLIYTNNRDPHHRL